MEIARVSRRELLLIVVCTSLFFLFCQFILQWDSDMEPKDEVTPLALGQNDVSFEDFKDNMPQRSDLLNQIKNMDNSDVPYGYDFNVDRIERDIENPKQYAESNKLPFILWWTPFTGDMGSVKKCSKGQCFFSQDRTLFDHHLNQVLMFYGTNINTSDLPLPRKGHHEWAVLHEESPKNNVLFYHEDFISLFNHTSTFRQISDYPITTQYMNSLEQLQRQPFMSFPEKDKQDIAPAMFLQSGCNPPSDRDAYIHELMKYLQVDSYGACLKNKELPNHLKSPLTMHDDSLRDFVGKYKFALTFENAICDDYITEKLWRPLAAGTVPVYKGAPNILEWLPDKKSAILVDDFESPKDLANYLRQVAENESEYTKYLDFKKHGITNGKLLKRIKSREWGVNDLEKMSFITGFECFVCDRLHENKIRLEMGKQIIHHMASIEHYGCPEPKMYHFQSPPQSDTWERETWQLEYNDAVVEARKLRTKIFSRNSDN